MNGISIMRMIKRAHISWLSIRLVLFLSALVIVGFVIIFHDFAGNNHQPGEDVSVPELFSVRLYSLQIAAIKNVEHSSSIVHPPPSTISQYLYFSRQYPLGLIASLSLFLSNISAALHSQESCHIIAPEFGLYTIHVRKNNLFECLSFSSPRLDSFVLKKAVNADGRGASGDST
jgi:hypothetical protein